MTDVSARLAADRARLDALERRAVPTLTTVTVWKGEFHDDIRAGRELLDALQAVLDLHKPWDIDKTDKSRPNGCCQGCEELDQMNLCVEWPCPTVAAISAALTPGETE